jgi:hypothetical protein
MNGNLNDTINGANLYNGYNYSFTSDRFNNSNSAIYFNNGFLQIPDGHYFNGDFSVSIWININSFNEYARIIDFGCLTMSVFGSTGQVLIKTNTQSGFSNLFASSSIQLGLWYHLAYVLQGTTGFVYVNGVLVSSGQQLRTDYGIRKNNYLARSQSYINANAIYDELRLYEGAISSSQIANYYFQSIIGKCINYFKNFTTINLNFTFQKKANKFMHQINFIH